MSQTHSRGATSWRFALVSLCFILSGMAGLIYETAWSQEFALVFGTAELAIIAVLTAYMAGLAGGAWIAGKFMHRVRRPVLVYALLELGIGAVALLVPVFIGWAGSIQASWFATDQLSSGNTIGLATFDFLVSFVILIIPTAMMGATLPLLARYAVEKDEQIGPRIGLLYTMNTIGAAAGAMSATFLLLPNMGLEQTIWVAIALNVLVFVFAYLLARGADKQRFSETSPEPQPRFHWILPAILLSGAISFTLEVVWARLLAHVFGGSHYAFGTMLATFLVAIAAGSAVASRLAKNPQHAGLGFGLVQLGVAVSTLIAFAFANTLPNLIQNTNHTGLVPASSAALLSALAMFPGAFFSGAAFPFAIRLLAKEASSAGAASATVYTWNTVGSILGITASGLILLPALQFNGTIHLSVALSLALAAVAFLIAGTPRFKSAKRLAAAVAIAGIFALFIWQPPSPDRLLKYSPLGSTVTNGELVHLEVGRSATVALREIGNDWRITTNGLPESLIQGHDTMRSSLPIAAWLAMLPHAVRPDMDNVLIIGFGAGITTLSVPETVANIDVVELEPAVIKTNQLMAEKRREDPLANPRLTVTIDDARGALRRTRSRYDAIVSQPSHPWTGGAANLFTREFFSLVESRLHDDGVFLQWIGVQFADEALFKTTVATLRSVFTNVEVYAPARRSALLFLASNGPLSDHQTFARSIDSARERWQELHVFNPIDVTITQQLSSNHTELFSGEAPLNRDRRNLLKIKAPMTVSSNRGAREVDIMFRRFDPLEQAPSNTDWPYTVKHLLRSGQKQKAKRLLTRIRDPLDRQIVSGQIALFEGRVAQGTTILTRVVSRAPDKLEATAALLSHHRGRLNQQGATEKLINLLPEEARVFIELWRLKANGDPWEASAKFEPDLAKWQPGHPFYELALQERLLWRIASFDPNLRQETTELFNQYQAYIKTPRDVLVAVQYGISIKDQVIVNEGFQRINRSLRRMKPLAAKSMQSEMNREMLRFFHFLPSEHNTWAVENLQQWVRNLPAAARTIGQP